jgi:hypothetical protein
MEELIIQATIQPGQAGRHPIDRKISVLDPSPAQVEQLNRETALPAAEQTHLGDGKLKLELEPNALVVVKVDR